MEIIQSVEEKIWNKVNTLELTESEKTLLMSNKEEDKVAKEQLLLTIKSKRYTKLTATKSKEFVDLYNSIKPTLEENDVYELISCDVFKNDTLSGILNFRLNGEHKQIRF